MGAGGCQVVAQLIRVQDLVTQQVTKQDSERTNQFLYASSYGNAATIRQVSMQSAVQCQCHLFDTRLEQC